ncbi:hypothetical protein BpHYR1_043551 [Brachionus plicatilis]|uniref:Uncharacterized protein n=1 Tax=Brachionus plicatilis TaxID=10195 RepID=A0A3M7PWY6_BRAPC|nr:hypothetical protein BpHYR1_043551 [Brachionus plicatilis]
MQRYVKQIFNWFKKLVCWSSRPLPSAIGPQNKTLHLHHGAVFYCKNPLLRQCLLIVKRKWNLGVWNNRTLISIHRQGTLRGNCAALR